MSADTVVYVALGFSAVHPFFVVAHIEEGLVRVFARRVVRVEVVLLRALQRLFDVVEDVMGDLVENFLGS